MLEQPMEMLLLILLGPSIPTPGARASEACKLVSKSSSEDLSYLNTQCLLIGIVQMCHVIALLGLLIVNCTAERLRGLSQDGGPMTLGAVQTQCPKELTVTLNKQNRRMDAGGACVKQAPRRPKYDGDIWSILPSP